MMMRTVSGQRSRTSFRNSTPDRPGIRWSQKITWTKFSSISRVASSALRAVRHSKSSSSAMRMAFSECTSSSTSRMEGSVSAMVYSAAARPALRVSAPFSQFSQLPMPSPVRAETRITSMAGFTRRRLAS